MEDLVMPVIGSHTLKDVLMDWINPLIMLAIFWIVGRFITKRISQKDMQKNNIIYSLLLVFYIVVAIQKSYKKINLPPHNLLKDMCTVQQDLIILGITLLVPTIYSIIILAKYGDKQIEEKREKKKE